MKKLMVILFGGFLFACNTETNSSANDKATTASSVAVNYPYTIEHPDYWEMGSSSNTLVALNALKAWEEGKIDESLKYFGDSVRMEFDGLNKKMPNDSVKAMLGSAYNSYKNIKIKMTDWESVVSKDKAEEWVTVWYTQHWETGEGVKDSAAIINDFQLKNGKIVRLSEYTRDM